MGFQSNQGAKLSIKVRRLRNLKNYFPLYINNMKKSIVLRAQDQPFPWANQSSYRYLPSQGCLEHKEGPVPCQTHVPLSRTPLHHCCPFSRVMGVNPALQLISLFWYSVSGDSLAFA